MVDVECPAEDCDYMGPVSSVEGHISGSTNGWHSGRQGRQYRDVLTSRAEGVAEAATLSDDTGEATSEEAGEMDSEAAESADPGVGEVPAAAGVAGAGLLGLSDSGVSTTTVLLVVAVVGVLLLATASGPATDGVDADVAGSEETGEEDFEDQGGLRG